MAHRLPTDAITGAASQIEALRAQITRLASFDAPGNPHVPTVLLLGETGTGKGLVARVIHDAGPRAAGPFIDVNCAAIPEAMLEAELFGFEAGAFTDAKRTKPGLFEAASAGTLFLDEIDSLSPPVQSKVLKAIEEKRVRRLGAVSPRQVDVKLIAATQRDLPALVAAGSFRADLYHRLAVLILPIVPLRERNGDALLLAEHYLATYAAAHGLAPKRLTDSGRAWLMTYTWPGNVRELGHLMERVTLLCPDEELTRETFEAYAARVPAGPAGPTVAATAPPTRSPDGNTTARTTTGDAIGSSDETARIRAALARAGGNVVGAARLLGIGRNALRYRMRRLGIAKPDLTDLAPRATEARQSLTPGAPDPRPGAPTAEPAGARGGTDTAPPPKAAWEQKSVAVLVISLTIPDAAAAFDYEPWTAARRGERAVVERVEGFGGVFVERAPSRLTAAFGIPRALEQSAQRAVQAALAILRAVAQAASPRPELRAAVHVGDLRLDASDADPTARLVPIGDTFALPERLLGHTGAGEVLLSPAAARRVERSFELSPRSAQLGPAAGDRLTVQAVVRQQPRSGLAAVSETSLAFVGRGRELDLLVDAFARAAGGHGQVVFVSGEAGIGKSRLLGELRRRLDGRAYQWIEGRCASYGSTTPFLPLIDGLRRYFGIDDRDDEGGASAKLERAVAGLGTELSWTLPFVKQLLSLDVADDRVRALDSASRRSELFRALRALMLRAAEIDPLVVVVEDLHWIDPASEEWLAFLADVVPTTRALLLLSHRTGYRHPLPAHSFHVHVALPPLSGGDMAAITGSLLGAPEIPTALRALIADKAEGNPFFVEELVHSLIEDGSLRCDNGHIVVARDLARLAVPHTVQDVLSARIDRLAEDARRAIQVASVIGREFALRLLARISDAGEGIRGPVEELRSLELIYEKALHPELAYMFKHALTHDVAYESVVADRRRRLHVTIGRAIEDLYADRLAEHYETLAHHFSRGEEWQRALLYHERSAEKAADTHANRGVVHHCREALAITDRLGAQVGDDVRCRLNRCLGQACFYLSEYAASGSAFEEAAARSSDAAARSLDLAGAAFSFFWAHRYDSASRCVAEALAVAEAGQVPAGIAMATVVRGFAAGVHDAEVDAYERCLDDALAICARHPNEAVEAFARFQTVMVAEWTGAYGDAVQRAERAMAMGRKLRRPEVIIFSTWFLGKARCCTGDYGGAVALLEDAYALCDRIGDRAWKSRMLNTLGWCFAEIGSIEQAREYNERAATLAREIGDPEILSNADINLAVNHLALGDTARALAFIEPLEAALARPGDPWMRWRYGLHVRDVRGLIELARGAADGALAAAEAQLDGARRHRVAKVEVRALTQRGAALLELERYDDAEASLRDGIALADRIGYLRGVWRAHGLLAKQLRRRGATAAAAEHDLRARAAVERAAGSLADAELRRRLIASALGEPA
jgi:DNA-binding NtrC family response regulator/tetratricopeptide (TPR) repeat protein